MTNIYRQILNILEINLNESLLNEYIKSHKEIKTDIEEFINNYNLKYAIFQTNELNKEYQRILSKNKNYIINAENYKTFINEKNLNKADELYNNRFELHDNDFIQINYRRIIIKNYINDFIFMRHYYYIDDIINNNVDAYAFIEIYNYCKIKAEKIELDELILDTPVRKARRL